MIIYAASGGYPELVNWFIDNDLSVSIISMVETLEYHKIRSREKAALDTIFSFLIILFPGPEKLKIAIGLRQLRPMSLGDSLIAATALVLNIPLATHNTKDFTWITNLNI